MMPKSRRKEKFQFLKQILEETASSASDKENDRKKDTTDISSKSGESVQQESGKHKKDRSGPVGKYPVLFSKTCKNKSCQTRLSSFPLFPLPEETEWISDGEAEKKKKSTAFKKKRKQKQCGKESKKYVDDKDYSEAEKLSSKVKNSDGTRKDFRSEHQLKETDNPVLQAWLHKKSIASRKQRKLQRKERRAKRAVLEEEARIKEEREIECNEKVVEWLKRKRKEARISWRKNRTRVGPQNVDTISPGGSSPRPPPEYRVVRSFQCTDPSPVTEAVPKHDKLESSAVNLATPLAKIPSTSCNDVTNKLGTKDTEDKTNQNCIKSNQANTVEKVKCRPKTAVGSTETASHTRPKTAVKRPKTAREKSSRNTTPVISSSDSPKKMQSLSYDEWLKVKRVGDKERTIQKKRELIDAHLEAVIKELGKKRVEKIMSPRKRVDTDLKNTSHPPEPVQSADSKPKKNSPYRWLLSKKPRPEPQGCDYPETQRTERNSQYASNDSHAKDENLVVQSDHDQSTSTTPEQPKVHGCQEVEEKYNELKPSIEKVKDILDAEIKKLKESRMSSDKELNRPNHEAIGLAEPTTKSSRSVSARPTSARPVTAQPASPARPGSAYLTEEQAKKIAADLDILGLCGSDPEQGNDDPETKGVNGKHDQKSTVRENYFDYGSDVETPTTTTPEFVQ